MQHQRGVDRSETADAQLELPQTFSLEQETILKIVRHPELGQIRYALVRLLVRLTL